MRRERKATEKALPRPPTAPPDENDRSTVGNKRKTRSKAATRPAFPTDIDIETITCEECDTYLPPSKGCHLRYDARRYHRFQVVEEPPRYFLIVLGTPK